MKKLLYVTGSRAEYGIMKRLLLALEEDQDIELTIVATGMHCDPTYGNTYKVIEKDGLEIDKLISININTSNNAKILDSMSICQSAFGDYFQEKEFDAVMLLGDRYEIFAVAIAAAMHNLPIIHLHGGEKTLGNYDEFIRHSITKMSKLHLASTEEYRQRIIQMGEFPQTVYNIGALGAENAMLMTLPNKLELETNFGQFKLPYFMVVFHPETLGKVSVETQFEVLLSALSSFKGEYEFLFIGSNSDTGSDVIKVKTLAFCEQNGSKYLTSVKPEEYLALNKYSQGLIGNSSSGLIEIPSLHVPTINIGDRQKGRVRGASVIDVLCDEKLITESIVMSQTSAFKNNLEAESNPYRKENTLQLALNIIKKSIKSDFFSNVKDFHDLD